MNYTEMDIMATTATIAIENSRKVKRLRRRVSRQGFAIFVLTCGFVGAVKLVTDYQEKLKDLEDEINVLKLDIPKKECVETVKEEDLDFLD